MNILTKCTLCPRRCGTGRANGYCKTGNEYYVASICLHKGEEPVLSGQRGMCNIFFYHCNLQCIYCQNYAISRNTSETKIMGLNDIVERVCGFIDSGIECVGFVSPSHSITQMKEIIRSINSTGRRPVYVMNTNAYDMVQTVAELEDSINVYLPDFKYMDTEIAGKYSRAKDYPRIAIRAIREMFRQKGSNLALNENDIIQSGLIIRHLVLPGHVENSKAVLRAIAEELSTSVHISLMSQYNPVPDVLNHPLLGRTITEGEYKEVLDEFYGLGFHRGWVQEFGSHSSYLPDFSKEYPFE